MQLHRNAKLGPAGRHALVRAVESGMTLKEAAASFSVSPATAHRWWHRWRQASPQARRTLACLADRSSRPHRSPRRLAPSLEAAICSCRRRTGWGPRLVAGATSVQRILDAMTAAPAFVRNGRLDLLAANRLRHAFYSQHFDSAHGPANSARFIFLDPRATDFYVDWEQVATDAVAVLRSEAGRDPYDRGLSDLVGELSTRSETFRTRWAAHNVRFHDTGFKRFHHPVVGDVELTYETMQLSTDEGLMMFAYTAEVGSKSEEALNLLASWTATLDEAEPASVTDND